MIEQYLPWALAVLPGVVVIAALALFYRPGRKRPARFSFTVAALAIAVGVVAIALYTAFSYTTGAS